VVSINNLNILGASINSWSKNYRHKCLKISYYDQADKIWWSHNFW